MNIGNRHQRRRGICDVNGLMFDEDATISEVMGSIATQNPFGEEGACKEQALGLEWGNNSAECFIGTSEGVFRARAVRRLEHKDPMGEAVIGI